MVFRRVLRLVLAFAVLAGSGASLPACKNAGGQKQASSAAPTDAAAAAVVVDTGERRIAIRVELARTPEQRERGLMYRDHLLADAGMLFLFERPSLQTFWMKNTPLPLDLIFISADRAIVGIVANAEPHTLTPRGVKEPSQYVLEIGGGLAASLGIRTGQRVEFRGVSAP